MQESSLAAVTEKQLDSPGSIFIEYCFVQTKNDTKIRIRRARLIMKYSDDWMSFEAMDLLELRDFSAIQRVYDIYESPLEILALLLRPKNKNVLPKIR